MNILDINIYMFLFYFTDQIKQSTNGLVLSPTHQQLIYEKHQDTRLPPDLLPYGPQSISLQQNSSAGIIQNDHTYISYNEPTVFYKEKSSPHMQNSSKDLHITFKDLNSSSCSSGSSSYLMGNTSIQQTESQTSLLAQQQSQRNNFPLHVQYNSSRLETPCKPRQSIVRTSPSFSFLSAGCQQQNNFL